MSKLKLVRTPSGYQLNNWSAATENKLKHYPSFRYYQRDVFDDHTFYLELGNVHQITLTLPRPASETDLLFITRVLNKYYDKPMDAPEKLIHLIKMYLNDGFYDEDNAKIRGVARPG